MRGAVQLLAIGVAALLSGCATTIETSFDETRDFSAFRTWDWLPRGRLVDAIPAEERRLGLLLDRAVGRELEARGLDRAGPAPDLLVTYQLRVRRLLVASNETGASQFVPSLHAGPSYDVTATRTRLDQYDNAHLALVITDGRREGVVWRGEIAARRRGHFARHLEDAVASLMADLPLGSPALPGGAAAVD